MSGITSCYIDISVSEFNLVCCIKVRKHCKSISIWRITFLIGGGGPGAVALLLIGY